MPPRTGPRRKRRPKPGPPPAALRLAIIRTDGTIDLVRAYRIELDDGNLVLRDQADAIIQIIASGEWCEIRPGTSDDIPYPEDEEATPPAEPDDREQATLVNENDPVFQPTRKEEQDQRFVPSSPEEAQRILMELERRLRSPEDSPDAPPPPPRKD